MNTSPIGFASKSHSQALILPMLTNGLGWESESFLEAKV